MVPIRDHAINRKSRRYNRINGENFLTAKSDPRLWRNKCLLHQLAKGSRDWPNSSVIHEGTLNATKSFH